MGACGAKLSDAEKDAIKKNKEVEAATAEAYRKEREKIKLLLLGAGESGKGLSHFFAPLPGRYMCAAHSHGGCEIPAPATARDYPRRALSTLSSAAVRQRESAFGGGDTAA
jgi:hypothetical protein